MKSFASKIHFLEIPKFINKPVKEMTKMERWMAYFSDKLNVAEKEELAMSEAAIGSAYDATLAFFQTPEERLKYLNRQMAIMDYQSGLESAEERGEERGEKRGEKRGFENGQKKEQERMTDLIRILKKAGRENELFEVAGDAEKLQQLYREFHL